MWMAARVCTIWSTTLSDLLPRKYIHYIPQCLSFELCAEVSEYICSLHEWEMTVNNQVVSRVCIQCVNPNATLLHLHVMTNITNIFSLHVYRYLASSKDLFTMEYDAAPQEYHRRMTWLTSTYIHLALNIILYYVHLNFVACEHSLILILCTKKIPWGVPQAVSTAST